MKLSAIRIAAALAVVAAVGAVDAQSQVGRVFRDRDVSESALIEALTPEEPIRTRSIRVRPGAPAPAARPAQASLLITFETNSADLTDRSRNTLDVVGKALKSEQLSEFAFSVEGHADPRGDHERNQRLSQARAESVVDYLVNTHNVARERLQPLGKGDRELANPQVPAAPENRRVTIKTQVK